MKQEELKSRSEADMQTAEKLVVPRSEVVKRREGVDSAYLFRFPHHRNRHRRGHLAAKIFCPGQHQLLDVNPGERLLPAQQVRDQRNLREVFHRLHFHVGVFDGISVGHHAMIRHQNGVIGRHIRLQRLRQFRSTRSAIARQRNAPQPHHHFTNQRLGKRHACRSEACRGWRMRMHNCLNVGPHAVNQNMHSDLAGHVPPSCDPRALAVHDHHVPGFHCPLAHASRSNQDPFVVQTDRQIPVHGRHEPALMQHAPVANNLFPVFAFCGHGITLLGEWQKRLKLQPPHSIAPCSNRQTNLQKKNKEISPTKSNAQAGSKPNSLPPFTYNLTPCWLLTSTSTFLTNSSLRNLLPRATAPACSSCSEPAANTLTACSATFRTCCSPAIWWSSTTPASSPRGSMAAAKVPARILSALTILRPAISSTAASRFS